jgi:hypothetical protein
MKKSIFTVMALLTMAAGEALAQGRPMPVPNPNGPQGSQSGQRGGKKLGPQDGSGPIHQPGTGGGTGLGRRAGRK